MNASSVELSGLTTNATTDYRFQQRNLPINDKRCLLNFSQGQALFPWL